MVFIIQNRCSWYFKTIWSVHFSLLYCNATWEQNCSVNLGWIKKLNRTNGGTQICGMIETILHCLTITNGLYHVELRPPFARTSLGLLYFLRGRGTIYDNSEKPAVNFRQRVQLSEWFPLYCRQAQLVNIGKKNIFSTNVPGGVTTGVGLDHHGLYNKFSWLPVLGDTAHASFNKS